MAAETAETVFTRTLRSAIEALGGPERLAESVDASVSEVEAWATGAEHPPARVFLKAIDVIAGR